MKILVTGGAGFIGSNFILYWLDKHPSDSIINLDLLTYAGNLVNLKKIEGNPQYKFVKGDITDVELVGKLMEEVEVVVHFAAESHVDRSILAPAPFIKTNVLGTYTLLEAAKNHKIKRFHHISTDEVFGALSLEDKSRFTEKTKYDPNSPYSATKAGSDHLVNAYYETYGLPVTITNCSNNYGPYQFPEKFIPLTITNIIEGRKIPVYGDGLYVRDWLHVEDHCRSIERVLIDGRVGETYLVGGTTEDISNIEVIRKILKIMGKDEGLIEYVKDRPGHDRRYAVDWSKIKSELGWQPLYSFDEWLEKTVNWYRENQDWWLKVKSGEYQSYYQLQYGVRK
ncbi:MAG: dTDP-glucose 4,6-dehydratase [Candidatus Gottesmanbacteria bacterium GW2011_GWC2_39_8]|uniref:dTDP-glucose 4,6-dehydratase n=1 Tax=Candidatus Gottesmanbacteria bacterium GW2011_GWC2_39_8 TaxID=1618450 RepID=A0A0G0Q1T0_9BACT|nr:MAG: dTDP-glucose 4,6-dehydratase [Candidatus Gottesmanbacteria bacterium GW2011_GWC2_39_8]